MAFGKQQGLPDSPFAVQKPYGYRGRNRHCPKCQSSAREAWLEARQAELLPAEYFHVVFTLPAEVRDIVRYNEHIVPVKLNLI